jgi:hypothetical protein
MEAERLSRSYYEKSEPVRLPGMWRDVLLPVFVFQLLIGVFVAAAVSVSSRPDLAGRCGAVAASGIGFLALYWRLAVYDGAVGLRRVVQDKEYALDVVEGSAAEIVVPQVQLADDSRRFSRYGAFEGFAAAEWARLAAALPGVGVVVTRDKLAGTGLWSNITGPGKHNRYLYQDVMADLEWLGWCAGGKLTVAGADWLGRFVGGRRLSSSAVGSGVAGADGSG